MKLTVNGQERVLEGVERTNSGQAALSRIVLIVNGKPHHLELDPRTSLLDALREHLRLTGTKKGCDHGQCGAVTVRINGRRINSGLAFALMSADDGIVAIESRVVPAA